MAGRADGIYGGSSFRAGEQGIWEERDAAVPAESESDAAAIGLCGQ